jgi:hypothetical protein
MFTDVKRGALHTAEMPVNTYHTSRRHMPEDSITLKRMFFLCGTTGQGLQFSGSGNLIDEIPWMGDRSVSRTVYARQQNRKKWTDIHLCSGFRTHDSCVRETQYNTSLSASRLWLALIRLGFVIRLTFESLSSVHISCKVIYYATYRSTSDEKHDKYGTNGNIMT